MNERMQEIKMSIFGEICHDEPTYRANPEGGIPFLMVMRDYVRYMVLAGLIAGNLLLMPALVQAAIQGTETKAVQASGQAASAMATPSATKAQTRVSPYMLANRQRTASSRAAHLPGMPLSIQRPHKSASRGQ